MTQADVCRNDPPASVCRQGSRPGSGITPFCATGSTQYLRNGGRRELAQQMAAHESPRTTALYDRRDDEVAVDEVERIVI
jgi:integrase/recombinase XerD